ncbi:hypothetical protein ACPV3S_18705 [Photobacterium damselae]
MSKKIAEFPNPTEANLDQEVESEKQKGSRDVVSYSFDREKYEL